MRALTRGRARAGRPANPALPELWEAPHGARKGSAMHRKARQIVNERLASWLGQVGRRCGPRLSSDTSVLRVSLEGLSHPRGRPRQAKRPARKPVAAN
eukprot:3198327-Pyramimonas_sp.AAC.1